MAEPEATCAHCGDKAEDTLVLVRIGYASICIVCADLAKEACEEILEGVVVSLPEEPKAT
jgi:hypothetical protein